MFLDSPDHYRDSVSLLTYSNEPLKGSVCIDYIGILAGMALEMFSFLIAIQRLKGLIQYAVAAGSLGNITYGSTCRYSCINYLPSRNQLSSARGMCDS